MNSATNILSDLVVRITEAGRSLRGVDQTRHIGIETLCEYLVSEKGEATGVAIAHEILTRYETLDDEKKHEFFLTLLNNFGCDISKVKAEFKQWNTSGVDSGRTMHLASEPKSVELIRRLNLVKKEILTQKKYQSKQKR